MSCPCDRKPQFAGLDISAGLDDIPRQIGGFSQFRRAMLAELRRHTVLEHWHARDEDDLGVMLLEMWAYVCDVLTFYDEAIANECYLRTADLRASLRKLTGLLGYIPRPAVAASVVLTALAEGRRVLNLKAGTAFRSQGFNGEAPQVFELDKPAAIHPLNNCWELDPQRKDTIGKGCAAGGAHDHILLQEENKRLQARDILLVTAPKYVVTLTVKKRSRITGDDGEQYVRLDLQPVLSIGSSTKLEEISLTTPTQTAGLWTMGKEPEAVIPDKKILILDGLYRQLKAGQQILVSREKQYRWFKLDQVSDIMMNATTGGKFEVENADGDKVKLDIPPALAPATQLILDVGLNHADRKKNDAVEWGKDDAARLIVHYALVDVGHLTRQRDTAIGSGSKLVAAPVSGSRLEMPVDGSTPTAVVLQDVNEISVRGNGSVNYDSGALDFQATDWPQPLTPPVKVFGNILQASRGETVRDETIGSGDATRANQTFKLKKSPLTYVAAPGAGDERGVKNTLKIWVDGIRWQEVPNFYGQKAMDEVYIVRQNDDQDTLIAFGDGRRGRRLPTGSDNVVASYRYGAGAAAPPENSITQLARPVKGFTAVNNPFAASGGDDAQGKDGIREYAPRSALLLGRAVSLQDFIAATAGMPGVQAVYAQWRWNNLHQRPVIQIWYIGGSDSQKISASLRNLADPAIALDVIQADSVALKLVFDVEVDERAVEDDVVTDIRNTLMDPDEGMLAVSNIGIGRPLYRSRLFAAILAVPGTVAVTNLTYDDMPFDEIAIQPGSGKYFDVVAGDLIINGRQGY
jgi:hypothetical protein